MPALRRLTQAGIERFRVALDALRSGAQTDLAIDWVNEQANSDIVAPLIEVEERPFSSKREAAEYLFRVLAPLARAGDVSGDVGLWSWLSILYFDSVCPSKNGKRKVVADSHYILEATDYQRRYRHLLATPYRIRSEVHDHNRIYLDAPLSVHGDVVEQTLSKLYLLRFPAVREVVDRLYFDEQKGKPKRGILPKKSAAKPGDLRNRFPLRISQLQRTYDLAGLDGDQLLKLLGREFDRWKRQAG